MEQVREFNPPPNPAKTTDSRYAAYIAEFGDESWELDALEPAVISGLIEAAVRGLLDMTAWQAAEKVVAQHRSGLRRVAEDWDEVAEWLRERGSADEE